MRVGIVGLSEGNGHPFSFSAIINGYNSAAFSKCGWDGIHDYLKVRKPEEFGFDGVRVVSAWTQDKIITDNLCRACNIETSSASYEELIDGVDIVIIARDDYQSHLAMAKPCLAAGKKVFIDKPLSLDVKELSYFKPFLLSGQLISGSGFRYARELDVLREGQVSLGVIKCIQAAVLNDLAKYGIHMLEAIAGIGLGTPISVSRLSDSFDCFQFELPNNIQLSLSCLGKVGKTFHIGIYGENGHYQTDLHDNFSAFRSTLGNLFNSIKTKTHAYDPNETINLMKAIIAAKRAKAGETLHVEDVFIP